MYPHRSVVKPSCATFPLYTQQRDEAISQGKERNPQQIKGLALSKQNNLQLTFTLGLLLHA